MSDTVLKVENLSKLYRLGEFDASKLREDIHRWWCQVWGKADPYLQRGHGPRRNVPGEPDFFWALKEVSFEVKRGEVLGVIGRNGAGKSTLLKILSRITSPTLGEIRVKGRIASLLEVGTGFNPELTGRENIYLNGTILGMRRREIARRFDEIVEFSGVERHIETPVKRYSSGMYVRLAFAVAAHLEPEILIVDEVLAVGDAEFQKKCLGKMETVAAKEGRTVLFVSHNSRAVETLCQTGLFLEAGRVKYLGSATEALEMYADLPKFIDTSNDHTRSNFAVKHSRPGISFISVDPVELARGNLVVDIGINSPVALTPPVPGVLLNSLLGTPVFASNPRYHQQGFGQPKIAEGVFRLTAKNLPIESGFYSLSVWLGDWLAHYDEKKGALTFEFKAHPNRDTRLRAEHIGISETCATWTVVSCAR